jgi:glycosyltransferase involved in cell wall biosynthesis
MGSLPDARIAIVHEWPVVYAGSEQVVSAMLEVFPQAALYALVHDPEALRGTPLEKVQVRTSFIQSLPKAKKKYRMYLPLMPLAVEQFDLRSYDIVISSSHAVAKGVITGADQLHLSYVYTPLRYAWDLYQDYMAYDEMSRGLKSWVARVVLHYVRLWDVTSANRVDAYLTLSEYIAQRIWHTYRRPARVIYPPVNVEYYRPDLPREEFFISLSRFVSYKRMDLIVDAFTRMGKPIVIIGEGPDFAEVQRIAGPNIELLGYQPDEVAADYLQRAKGFVFAAEEDFGIAPVEAQAAGCPVIAYGRGGTLETVVGWPETNPTGVFFDAQTPGAIEAAVQLFEAHEGEFLPENCRLNAQRFGGERFRRELATTIEDLWGKYQRNESLE